MGFPTSTLLSLIGEIHQSYFASPASYRRLIKSEPSAVQGRVSLAAKHPSALEAIPSATFYLKELVILQKAEFAIKATDAGIMHPQEAQRATAEARTTGDPKPWAQQIMTKASQDARRQPWKSSFAGQEINMLCPQAADIIRAVAPFSFLNLSLLISIVERVYQQPPHQVIMERGAFRYLKWQDLYTIEKPFQVLIDLPNDAEDKRQSNIEFYDGPEVDITDVRGITHGPEIDTHGFTYLQHDSCLEPGHFLDKGMVQSKYLPECEVLLRHILDGVDEVHFFNWLVRDTSSVPAEGKQVDINDPLARVGAARVAHIDQTFESAVDRVYLELPSKAEELLQGRLRLINLWRPINGPVESFPLALCDGRTISPDARVEADRIRRKYTGGTTFVLEEPGQTWYYLSQQQNNEVAMFKNFDSDDDVTKYAPHCSFVPLSQDPSNRPRQSIEVRALVFTYSCT
ncbi:uncharacterized protein N7482_007569 [Penicillium canariense]|uniref:Uncharacterized protein n=1 Tax=Penicillium canariense TaxID=189055 RepID=A0A9W9LJZ4_9EURO|nr:uncharacterized protein N7482_007569 [Penicillium canariense]KAJ5160565.1 hypothetical protein N7482_007569 [Penicillium canariense]